jgi:serine/threonine protein kinase/tetratricopeptide (TPR) repeat protein
MPRCDTPRDLLFGLLGLHNGMVGRDQLVAAFGAWTACDRSMAELLVEQGALSAERRALLETFVADHLAAHGDDPAKSLAALDLNDATRASLTAAGGASLEATMVHIASGSESEGGNHAATFTVGGATADVQRFRVLRHHARGGLGAVFVALDNELNREVALKQLLAHHADDPVSRMRFLAEAEITGGLEHPGIVPVYSLGSDGDGRPYYAMRFIRGDNLKEAIDRFHGEPGRASAGSRRKARGANATPLAFRQLLRRFIDVCNAIDYAHSHGVLHRDIKPGNVIIGRHGETLVVDWGLAKQLGKLEPSHAKTEPTLLPGFASASAETLRGMAIGTPAYMSPEQAAGDLERLDPRSDVYSLGATLYCLITGKPPFDGTVNEILRKVQSGEFLPLRQVDPAIDRALEAICCKAMAMKPEVRYASCRALAEDVERWMADEPVSAYREPWTRSVARWLNRHRTGVTAVAAAVMAGLVGVTALALQQAQSNAALTRANTTTLFALGEARQARDATRAAFVQSEESRKEAEAVSNFMVDALKKPDPAVDGKDAKVADVLDQAAAALEQRFAGPAESQGALLDALGRSYLGLGLYAKAEESHRKAQAMREKSLGPSNRETLRSATRHAAALWYAGRRTESVSLLEDALRRQRDALAPDDDVTLETRDCLGWRYTMLDRPDEGIAMLREVLAARESKLGPDHPETLTSRNNLAAVYSVAGRNDEAIRMLETTLRQKESKLGPDHPETLASQSNLASVYHAAGRYADAVRLHEATLRKKESKLGPDHPDTLVSRTLLANSYQSAGRYADAIRLQQVTLKAREAKLGSDHPDTLTSRIALAGAYESLGRWADAEVLRRENLAHLRAREKPDSPRVAGDLVDLGHNLIEQGKNSEAEPILRECLAIREKAIPNDWRRFWAMSLLGRALLEQGKFAEAEPLVVAGYDGLKARQAKMLAANKPRLFDAAGHVVRLYEARGKPELARSWAQKAGVGDLPAEVFAKP